MLSVLSGCLFWSDVIASQTTADTIRGSSGGITFHLIHPIIFMLFSEINHGETGKKIWVETDNVPVCMLTKNAQIIQYYSTFVNQYLKQFQIFAIQTVLIIMVLLPTVYLTYRMSYNFTNLNYINFIYHKPHKVEYQIQHMYLENKTIV